MLYFAVILYNKEFSESFSINSLINSSANKNSKIIVFDNSSDRSIKNINQRSVPNKIEYLNSNHGNIGLSKAYNLIVDYLWEIGAKPTDYLCLLDDDTELSSEFFEKVNYLIDERKDIIFPVIVGQNNKVYSPNNWGYIKNSKFNFKQSIIDNYNINAINSCLTIKMKIFEKFRYNESLFLDQVDQLFFDSIRNRGYSYGLANVIVIQNFSQRDSVYGNSYLQRFNIRTKDLITYGRISPYNNVIMCYIKNILLGITMTLRAHTLTYFLVGLKSIKYWRERT
ncbi:glycosyltransferase [Enterococcus casseliflavus]|uniref:glycosyltransferase n=1 Tax=Enterococcus casseliflavus TaxID=37734 RepID=UPI003D0E10B1